MGGSIASSHGMSFLSLAKVSERVEVVMVQAINDGQGVVKVDCGGKRHDGILLAGGRNSLIFNQSWNLGENYLRC
jgi:hypothetical protein